MSRSIWQQGWAWESGVKHLHAAIVFRKAGLDEFTQREIVTDQLGPGKQNRPLFHSRSVAICNAISAPDFWRRQRQAPREKGAKLPFRLGLGPSDSCDALARPSWLCRSPLQITAGFFSHWRSKRAISVRSIDHGSAEQHQICRWGRSSARCRRVPMRSE